MQEEVENKTVNLAISTTKLTGRVLIKALRAFLQGLDKWSHTGKQSVKKLVKQNQGVTSIDIKDTDIRGFDRYAKKYGIDYAITKDKTAVPPKYTVFIKARDTDALKGALGEYTASMLQKDKKPSVLAQLHNLVQQLAEMPGKVHEKKQERER